MIFEAHFSIRNDFCNPRATVGRIHFELFTNQFNEPLSYLGDSRCGRKPLVDMSGAIAGSDVQVR